MVNTFGAKLIHRVQSQNFKGKNKYFFTIYLMSFKCYVTEQC